MTKWKPAIGDPYYIPEIIDGEPNVFASEWGNDAVDNKRYEAGIAFRNMADAVDMARDMLSVAGCVSGKKVCLPGVMPGSPATAPASDESTKLESLAGLLGVVPYQLFRIKDEHSRYLFYLSEKGLCMVDVVENAIDDTACMNHLLAYLLFGRNEIVSEAVWVPFGKENADDEIQTLAKSELRSQGSEEE